jgi:hypothetical protein
MRVITSNPIISNNKIVNSDNFYLSAEGDPKMLAAMNKRQVQAFQDYMNVRYPNWYIPTKGTLPKDSSKYGDKTDSWTITAWKLYGDDWYKGAMGITKAIESTNPFSVGNLFGNLFDKPKTQPKKQTQTELPPPPPPKGLSMTTKILIGVGSVVVLGTIIYLITRKK